MKLSYLLILMNVIIVSCNQQQLSGDNLKSDTALILSKDSLSQFFQSNGVVTFINTDDNIRKGFKIFNGDGSDFMKIVPFNDSINFQNKEFRLSDFDKSKQFFQKHHFSPKGFWPDYHIFQFEYLQSKDNFIEIYIDEAKSITKKLSLDTTLFKVENWKEHIVGTMIDFHTKKDIIRVSPIEDSKSLGYENSEEELFFVATEIKGDWIYIESKAICGFSQNAQYNGWLRWKKEGKLLITFAYAC
ncbi:hypothetical protein [Emticicia agri]|uniref:Lipoprotein n=1 Tax=Emticicia agri TaxID=2492393 RepID=A0A4Q5M063_9BACT|nr:hypothetical protein [Emticicia agri]RYU95581.1 hypothetical protein EWM59_10745 [Emticicia agri]